MKKNWQPEPLPLKHLGYSVKENAIHRLTFSGFRGLLVSIHTVVGVILIF